MDNVERYIVTEAKRFIDEERKKNNNMIGLNINTNSNKSKNNYVHLLISSINSYLLQKSIFDKLDKYLSF